MDLDLPRPSLGLVITTQAFLGILFLAGLAGERAAGGRGTPAAENSRKKYSEVTQRHDGAARN